MVNSGLFAETVYKIWQTHRQGLQYILKKRREEVVQTFLVDLAESRARGNSRGEDTNLADR
jgi:hypothetical protein